MTTGRVVMRSIEAPEGIRCVDIFRRCDASWGWAEYRRDPEDPRGWAGPGDVGTRFPSQAAALEAARAAIAWLRAVGTAP